MNQNRARPNPAAGQPILPGLPDAGEPLEVGQAPLTNMGLALRTLMDCMAVGRESPRLGLLYGYSGYGKSVGAAFAAARTNATYVCAKSVWTQRTLLEGIAGSLGIMKLVRTAPGILDQVIEQLTIHPRPLVIHEMDLSASRSRSSATSTTLLRSPS